MEQELWDVARPAGASRVPGVRMAGFRERGAEWLDLRVVPHPAVMVVIEFGDGPVVIDRSLAERAEAGPAVDPEVAYAWERIVAQAGHVRVDDLAAASGWTRKRLWSRFTTQIGLTPKRAAMLVRFDRAAHRLVTGDAPAQVAADCGYTDQSHLHRDVVSFAAATPAALASSAWLSVDEAAWSP